MLKNDSSLILGHPTELQTFSLCDTMKCQMTANLHGRTIENPRPCFVPKRDAKANNAFHTCVRMSKKWWWTSLSSLLHTFGCCFSARTTRLKIRLHQGVSSFKSSRMLPIQMIFVGNEPLAHCQKIHENEKKINIICS